MDSSRLDLSLSPRRLLNKMPTVQTQRQQQLVPLNQLKMIPMTPTRILSQSSPRKAFKSNIIKKQNIAPQTEKCQKFYKQYTLEQELELKDLELCRHQVLSNQNQKSGITSKSNQRGLSSLKDRVQIEGIQQLIRKGTL